MLKRKDIQIQKYSNKKNLHLKRLEKIINIFYKILITNLRKQKYLKK